MSDEPDDGDQDITRGWLAMIGFKQVPSCIGPEYSDDMERGGLQLMDYNDNCWLITDCDRFELRKRWQIRALLNVFGID